MTTNEKPTVASGGHGPEDNGGRLCASSPHVTPARAGRQVLTHGDRVVGIIQHGVLSKSVQGSRHFLRQPPAIAFDLEALNTAAAQDVTQVVVTDTETSDVYACTLADLRVHGWVMDRMGYGKQIAMRLTRWHKNGQPPQDTQPPRQPAPQPQQLTLW